MKQTLYLNKVLQYYRENDIQIGDPDEGTWQEAHTPLPASMGDTTCLLLKEDHIIHDIYQSWELGEIHFFIGHAKNLLYSSGKFVENWFNLCDMYEELVKNWERGPGCRGATSKELREWSKLGHKVCKEKKVGVYKEGTSSLGGTATFKRKVGIFSDGLLGKGAKTTNSQKWRCMVTGKISTPGPLTMYQKSKGIDTSLREKVG